MEIKTFDGDIKSLYNMMLESWTADYQDKYKQPVQDFSPDFISWNLEKPYTDPYLYIGAYDGSKIVGFAAAIPYLISFGSNILKGTLSTFFTCHRDYRRQGIGTALATERLKRIIKREYDLNYFVQDEGHKVELLYPKLSKEMDLNLKHFCRFSFLAKILNRKKVSEISNLSFYEKLLMPVLSSNLSFNGNTSINKNIYVENIVQKLNFINDKNGLQVLWTKSELDHQLKSKLSDTIYYKEGRKQGIINFYCIDLIGDSSRGNSAKITLIDLARFFNMSLKEQHLIVSRFCNIQKKNGSCMVLLPTFSLFDLKPFITNLFVPTGRYHNIRGYDFKNILSDKVYAAHLMFR